MTKFDIDTTRMVEIIFELLRKHGMDEIKTTHAASTRLRADNALFVAAVRYVVKGIAKELGSTGHTLVAPKGASILVPVDPKPSTAGAGQSNIAPKGASVFVPAPAVVNEPSAVQLAAAKNGKRISAASVFTLTTIRGVPLSKYSRGELRTSIKHNSREAQLAQRILDHTPNEPDHRMVADCISARTVERFMREIGEHG